MWRVLVTKEREYSLIVVEWIECQYVLVNVLRSVSVDHWQSIEHIGRLQRNVEGNEGNQVLVLRIINIFWRNNIKYEW